DSLKKLLSSSPGLIPVYLHLNTPNKSRVQVLVGQELFIDPQEKLIQEIEDLLGQNSVVLNI
ncbi:MAG: hypothetical protein V1919_00785, partial [Candidatus Omnitrophota bacterium]